MALDRQSIEKQDFPMGRRGYDPEAVDAHLKRIAAEVEELKASGRGSSASLASSAGEQVRVIVDAAETTAREIRAGAEREAKKILADARRELRKARNDAAGQASAQVTKITEATASLLARIEAMDQELDGVVDALRAGASRLSGDLQLLEGMLGEVRAAVVPPAEPVEEQEEEAEVLVAAVVVEDEGEQEAGAAAVVAAETGPGGAEAGGGDEDLEGARLIALNMALNGTSREEVGRYLDENFDLSDRDALLDEVYASVEG